MTIYMYTAQESEVHNRLTDGNTRAGKSRDTVPCTMYLVHDVLKLHDGDPDEPVVPAEAVVFHPDVQLVGRHLVLVADDAEHSSVSYLKSFRCSDC